MKIFAKLFLLLAAVSVVPLVSIAGLALWRSGTLQSLLLAQTSETGAQATRASEEALYQQSIKNHSQLVREKASRIDAFYDQTGQSVVLASVLAQGALDNPPSPRRPPQFHPDTVAERLNTDPEYESKYYAKVPYTIWHAAPGADPEAVKLQREQLAALGAYFAQSKYELPWITSSYVGTPSGLIVGFPGGGRFKKEYDPRTRDWYKKAVDRGHFTWTDPYVDKDGVHYVQTIAAPVFSHDKKLLGVVAIDIELTDHLRNLFDLGALPVTQAYLLDDKRQVRLSAVYPDGHKTSEMPKVGMHAEHIDTFMGGRLAYVYDTIKKSDPVSGVVVPPGMETGILQASDDELMKADLYAYGRIVRRTGSGEIRDWYYVVRTPIDHILKPARGVQAVLRKLNDSLATLIAVAVRNLSVEILVVMAVALGLVLLIAWLAAHSVSRPLLHIADVVKKIGTGDLEQKAVVPSKDEIGDVARAINDMTAGLKEALFVKSTFKRYVAASVVDQLIKDPDKLRLGGERKNLTVFFSDISGFTTLSEKMSPEVLVELINEYLGAMTDSIFSHEGTLDKYEGDAIMAFWGAPIEQPDHALKACKAALDNLVRLKKLDEDLAKRGMPTLDIRVGLNTGPMVVGNMGSPMKMEYTVLGDAVNLGSRLEGVNKVYHTHIMISETTRHAAGDAIVTRELDLIAVKGKTQAVRVYELVGLRGEVPQERVEGYRLFEDGLDAYRLKRWDTAEKYFMAALKALGEDDATHIFLERIEEFRKNPPPAGWTGTAVLTEK